MQSVRCNACGQFGLPVKAGTKPNAGIAKPCAHAKVVNGQGIPCFQGYLPEQYTSMQTVLDHEPEWDL